MRYVVLGNAEGVKEDKQVLGSTDEMEEWLFLGTVDSSQPESASPDLARKMANQTEVSYEEAVDELSKFSSIRVLPLQVNEHGEVDGDYYEH